MAGGEKGFVVWLTGLPASGKTTLARLLESRLREMGWRVEVLDGDEVRIGSAQRLASVGKTESDT